MSLTKKLIGREDASAGETKKKTKKTPAAKQQEKEQAVRLQAANIDLVHLLTERSVDLSEHNVVTFKVAVQANKYQIAQAVEKKYGVSVSRVRTARMRPKARRRGYTQGRTVHWKRAYVQVDDPSKIGVAP